MSFKHITKNTTWAPQQALSELKEFPDLPSIIKQGMSVYDVDFGQGDGGSKTSKKNLVNNMSDANLSKRYKRVSQAMEEEMGKDIDVMMLRQVILIALKRPKKHQRDSVRSCLDVACREVGVTIHFNRQKEGKNNICYLFIAGVMIASHKAKTIKLSRKHAYEEAFVKLQKPYMRVVVRSANYKELEVSDKPFHLCKAGTMANVMTDSTGDKPSTKEKNKIGNPKAANIESNLGDLITRKPDKPLEEFVILEPLNKIELINANSTVRRSANLSEMLCEYEYVFVNQGSWKATLRIEKFVICEGYGSTKPHARDDVSLKALRLLQNSCWTIEILKHVSHVSRINPNKAITHKTISDADPSSFEAGVMKVLLDFKNSTDVEILPFAWVFDKKEMKVIYKNYLSLGLRGETLFKNRIKYFCVWRSLNQLFEHLQRCGGKFAQYRLKAPPLPGSVIPILRMYQPLQVPEDQPAESPQCFVPEINNQGSKTEHQKDLENFDSHAVELHDDHGGGDHGDDDDDHGGDDDDGGWDDGDHGGGDDDEDGGGDDDNGDHGDGDGDHGDDDAEAMADFLEDDIDDLDDMKQIEVDSRQRYDLRSSLDEKRSLRRSCPGGDFGPPSHRGDNLNQPGPDPAGFSTNRPMGIRYLGGPLHQRDVDGFGPSHSHQDWDIPPDDDSFGGPSRGDGTQKRPNSNSQGQVTETRNFHTHENRPFDDRFRRDEAIIIPAERSPMIPHPSNFNSQLPLSHRRTSRSPLSHRRTSRSPRIHQRNSRSPIIRRNPRSPILRRQSRSPILRRHSRSPILRRPSRSPILRRPSRSPILRRPSRSPILRRPSRSPILRRPSRSPILRRHSRSPILRRASRSPILHHPSRSPILRRPSRSPILRRPSRSPILRRHSRSPILPHPSRSPILRRPSRSPILRRPSRSPIRRHSRSPILRRRSARSPLLNNRRPASRLDSSPMGSSERKRFCPDRDHPRRPFDSEVTRSGVRGDGLGPRFDEVPPHVDAPRCMDYEFDSRRSDRPARDNRPLRDERISREDRRSPRAFRDISQFRDNGPPRDRPFRDHGRSPRGDRPRDSLFNSNRDDRPLRNSSPPLRGHRPAGRNDRSRRFNGHSGTTSRPDDRNDRSSRFSGKRRIMPK